jgi:hypothetical protein
VKEEELVGLVGIPAGLVYHVHGFIDIDDFSALSHPVDKFPHPDPLLGCMLLESGYSRFAHNIGDAEY